MVGCSDIFAKYRLARMSDGVKTRWRRGGQVLTPGRFFFLQELTLSPTSETRSSHPLSDDIWPNADVRCTLCDLLDVPSCLHVPPSALRVGWRLDVETVPGCQKLLLWKD